MDKAVESKYALEARKFECVECGSEIAPGAHYFSAIVVSEGTFYRQEYCVRCWQEKADDRERTFAYWKTTRPKPETSPAKRRRFDVELVWDFFRNLQMDLSREPSKTPIGGAANEADEVGAEGVEDEGVTRESGEESERVRLSFLLGLLLLRSKKLVLEGSVVKDGRELLRFSEKGNRETTYDVEDPHLRADDLEKVKETLGRLLQMEI